MAQTTGGNGFFHRHLFFGRNHAEPGETHWGWLLTLGILFVVLGTIGLGMLFLVTLASVLAFGVLILMGGAIQVVQAFSFRGWKGKASHLLIGLLYLAVAWILITDPLISSAMLTVLLAWTLIFAGVFRGVLAVQNRSRRRWAWPLVGGILSVALGGMILAQWPVTGLWVIGLFVTLEMIFHGWGYIALALVEKEGEKRPVSR